MRITRRMALFCALIFCCYFFFLRLFRPDTSKKKLYVGDSPEARRRLQMVDQACAVAFTNPDLRRRLARALVLSDADRFMKVFEKYFPTCTLEQADITHSHGFGLIDPILPQQASSPTDSYNQTNVSTEAVTTASSVSNVTTKPLCPRQSPLLRGRIDVRIVDEPKIIKVGEEYLNWPPTLEEIAVTYKDLFVGGYYPGPKDCLCRGYDAIIVPYRDREIHLRYFLHYIHQFLQRQQLCYMIIVVEQADNQTFNKGQMMNTGFWYARQVMPFDCYIFHDVDVIAEDDRVLYTCRDDRVMHYAPFIDKFDYKFFKGLTVGAAVGFTEDLFLSVNGYSNEYAGWGGEDDDMMERINMKKHVIWRSEQNYSRFKMIKHGTDPGNSLNNLRWDRLTLAVKRQPLDGFNNLDTTVIDEIKYKTHTRLKVTTYKTGLQKEMEKAEAAKPRPTAAEAAKPHPTAEAGAAKPHPTAKAEAPGVQPKPNDSRKLQDSDGAPRYLPLKHPRHFKRSVVKT